MENNTRTLTNVLWEGANILRSKMDANEYKDYLLPVVFYKYLSDKNLEAVNSLLSYDTGLNLQEKQKMYEDAWSQPETQKELRQELLDEQRYYLTPEHTYTYLIDKIGKQSFKREDLAESFKEIESCDKMYEGLFSDMDLYSAKLGTTEQKQSQTIIDLLLKINELNLLEYPGDAIGDAYEYMIGQFASETGKKAGEFYTPKQVSEILTRIAIHGQEDKKGLSVYDPAMGSASLLLDARKFSKCPDLVKHYGQEIMPTTFNLARMNMILHGVSPENQKLRNGDTLDADWPTTEENMFDMVVMNPPYSQSWSAAEGFKTDPRFSEFSPSLPPKSKADYAFLIHGYYHLKNTGTMAIVLPHGVLFRGAKEGDIRKRLCQKGAISAVIGLPENLFYNTSIPTAVIVLTKQHRDLDRGILFIDASREFVKEKRKNVLSEEQMNRIVDTYIERKDVEKYAHLASFEEIEKNDFNLNIPRYIDTSEEEEKVDIKQLVNELANIDKEIATLQKDVVSALSDLTADDKELSEGLSDIIKLLSKEN